MQGKNLPIYCNFDQIFAFWGALVPIFFSVPSQTLDSQSTLTCQISFESVYYVTFEGRKTAIFDIWGAPAPSPLTGKGQIWYATALVYATTFYTNMPNFVLLPSGGEKPQILSFWTLAFYGVDSWWQSEKVEHQCTTTNLPLFKSIKIVSVLQCLNDKIVHTNSDIP